MATEIKPPIKYDMVWTMYGKRADFFGIAERFHIDPVTARVIRNRDMITDEEIDTYLNGGLDRLHDPVMMKNMEKGCSLMLEEIRSRNRIRIISDYDVDGVSSNYILYKGLQRVWEHENGSPAGDGIDYDIPHRIYDGYGINIRMVDAAAADQVSMIITCDNGIAAFDAVRKAKEYGMRVIVTDHHDIPYDTDENDIRVYKVPEADAVIDHKQPGCEYPCKELCGAGVAYKFIQLLYRMCGIPEAECEAFIEILGIATVCDVMNLVDENRIIVREALHRLSDSSNYGLKALITNSGRDGKKLSAFDLGFIIGPCINAAGRLGDAKTSLEFLLETDSFKANERAIELLNINNTRKDMTEQGTKTAIGLLETSDHLLMGAVPETGVAALSDRVLVMYIPKLHESLVGIIAGRIKERYYRPVLLFTDSEEEGIIKGSGRSIEGYNMYDEINKCSDYFTKFGGHEMAAGFSMEKRNLARLREKMNANCTLDEKLLTPKLRIDVPMPLDYVSISLTEELEVLEPFGKGNEKPVFAQSGVRVKSARIMGKRQNVLRVSFLMENGGTIEGISFDPEVFISNIKQWFGTNECDKILKGMPGHVVLDVAYYPDINEFAGRRTLQIRLLEYRKHEE
jgi:single-stranded-DNA-specific exonuclease